MSSMIKICTDLLDLVDSKVEIITKQKTVIANLINENLEKENAINVLMQEENGMF